MSVAVVLFLQNGLNRLDRVTIFVEKEGNICAKGLKGKPRCNAVYSALFILFLCLDILLLQIWYAHTQRATG